jgi:hypothetical protein
MRRALQLLLGLLGLAGALSQCSTTAGSCSLIGCVNGAVVNGQVSIALAELEGASVTICFNDTCEDATLRLVGAGDSLARCDFADAPRRSCVAERISDSKVKLKLAYTLTGGELPSDGDRYSFRVRTAGDPDGELVDQSFDAAYEDFEPNGEGCEPTCQVATPPEK